MAVVINDFEVLTEPQPETRKPSSEGGSETVRHEKKKLEPRDVCAALRVLEVQALRTWAH